MNNEKMTFKVKNELGQELECEVLFTFESEETKKNYMVYTDNTTDENGNVKVYAAIYNPEDANSQLEPIESEKEWKIVETILDELQAEFSEHDHDHHDHDHHHHDHDHHDHDHHHHDHDHDHHHEEESDER